MIITIGITSIKSTATPTTIITMTIIEIIMN